MSKAAIGFGGLLMAVTVVGCADTPELSGVVRTDSAGVEVVTSAGIDGLLAWETELLFTLGGQPEGPQSFDAIYAETVGADAEGRIHIMDRRAHRVVVFDSTGAFIRANGQEGEGPGEMSVPASIAVTPDGSVSIFDYGRGGLVGFGPEGEVLATRPFMFPPWVGQPRHMAYSGSDITVASLLGTEASEGTFRYGLQRVSESDTLLVADRTFERPEMARYPECGGGLNLPKIFEQGIAWATEGQSVWVNRTPAYEIEDVQDGTLARRIRRDLPVRTATDAMAIAELGEGFRINFGQGPCTIPPRVMVDRRGFAPDLPWIAGITVAPGGELWVLRREVAATGEGPVDVFDPSGAYLGTMPAGTPFPVVFMSGERFGAIVKDDFDVMRLAVYQLSR